MTLPEELHGIMLESFNEILEQNEDSLDFEVLASSIVSAMMLGAEEYDVSEGDELIQNIEQECSLDAPLTEVLAEELAQNDEYTISGGELLQFLSEFLNLDWGEEINGDLQDLESDGYSDLEYGDLMGDDLSF